MLQNIAHVVADSSYITRFGLNLVIRQTKSQPIVQMTAKEFMFGYQSQLLTLGNRFMPGWITFEKLGLIDRVRVLFELSLKETCVIIVSRVLDVRF